MLRFQHHQKIKSYSQESICDSAMYESVKNNLMQLPKKLQFELACNLLDQKANEIINMIRPITNTKTLLSKVKLSSPSVVAGIM